MSVIGTGGLIRLDGVGHRYAHHHVLRDIDMVIESGQFTGIVGPSGSGKTTLLRALLDVLTPTHGHVHRRPGLRIGYVPQVEVVNWNFPVTVAETVLMARPRRGMVPWSSRAERAEAADVLERLGIGDLATRHIRALSGGQQQRVFIARALLRQPELLLLDEPTSGVDVRTRHEMLHVLDDLHDDGLAIVLTTHDLNGIAAHLPHVVCLNVAIQGQGSPHEVLTPAILERTYGAPMHVLHHAGLPLVVDVPSERPILRRVR
jgi:ABC-type Mn2+/Zn2+ transport system ATPase subunit